MNRNVHPIEEKAADGSVALTEPPPQDKLLAFFPAEALALYSALEPLARGIAKPENPDTLKTLLWAVLAISVLFCWIYLQQMWHIDTWQQRAISAGSLVLYVAALGGPFATISWYDPLMGAAAAVIASAFLIFVKAPKKP